MFKKKLFTSQPARELLGPSKYPWAEARRPRLQVRLRAARVQAARVRVRVRRVARARARRLRTRDLRHQRLGCRVL